MTNEALQTIRPYLDACNIDLKSFNDDFYRKNCGAVDWNRFFKLLEMLIRQNFG